jgi:CRP-like cAMP-binding protein
MTDSLVQFLEFYLPGQDVGAIVSKFREMKIKKGRHLLTPGKNCNYLAFIEHGAFRVYYYDLRGKEVITWFSFSEMVITDLLGFYTTEKATFYVQAIEDSTIFKITKGDLESLYKDNPNYLQFGKHFAEEALTILMDRTMSLHTKSAEERYKELLMAPHFMQKIPLKYLASYLGITDTSLSRIRKNIH